MRGLVQVVAVGTLLAGCATAAEREVERIKGDAAPHVAAIKACWARASSSPEGSALKDKISFDGATLAAKMDTSKATPEEAAQLVVLHDQYVVPCRKLALEQAARVNSALVPIVANSYARSDANYANVATRKITWGEFTTEAETITRERDGQVAEVGRQMQDTFTQAHNAELARRQAAAAQLGQSMMMYGAYVQAVNQPRYPTTTNCYRFGASIQCTSY
jgi:hypothetical protein